MDLTGKRIALIGGLGYIGRHVAHELLNVGAVPVIIDKATLPSLSAHFVERGAEVHRLNVLLDEDEPQDIDASIILAGLKSVPESLKMPEVYHLYNTSIVKASASRFPTAPILFSSSASVYAPSKSPLKETDRISPASPYAYSKLMCERWLEEYSSVNEVALINLRYFNPVFEVDDLYREIQDPPSNVVPSIDYALRMGIPFNVYGTDFDTPDGTSVRDYIHVQDLATAHIEAIKLLLGPKLWRSTFNIGTGQGTSLLELLKLYKEIRGEAPMIWVSQRRPGDVDSLIADPSLFKAVTGWDPNYRIGHV